jgi:hypothetical protein
LPVFCVATVAAIGGAVVAYESIQQTRIQQQTLDLNTKIHDKTLLNNKIITLEQYYDRHSEDKPPLK